MEEPSEIHISRNRVQRMIKQVHTTQSKRWGFYLSEPDCEYFKKQAARYYEVTERLENTPANDYSTRNILSYKLECIEDRFRKLIRDANYKQPKIR